MSIPIHAQIKRNVNSRKIKTNIYKCVLNKYWSFKQKFAIFNQTNLIMFASKKLPVNANVNVMCNMLDAHLKEW